MNVACSQLEKLFNCYINKENVSERVIKYITSYTDFLNKNKYCKLTIKEDDVLEKMYEWTSAKETYIKELSDFLDSVKEQHFFQKYKVFVLRLKNFIKKGDLKKVSKICREWLIVFWNV